MADSAEAGYGNGNGARGHRPMPAETQRLGRTTGVPKTSQRRLPHSFSRFIRAPKELRGGPGRNTFRKKRVTNPNAMLSRSWKLRGWAVNLRAEAIDLTNSPHFVELTDRNFSQINNTLTGRRAFGFQLRLWAAHTRPGRLLQPA